ncbi:hypothetical protein BH23CHL4_BH23CHL4_00130 [soil metagenome]
MFCTQCAAHYPPGITRCMSCGASIGSPLSSQRPTGIRIARRSGTSEMFAASSKGIMLLPFLVALVVGGWFSWQIYSEYQRESAAYARGEHSLETGDFVAAVDAFGEAGAYRDAPQRRHSTQQELAPVRSAYLDAMSALETGEFENAIALLRPIHQSLPGYENVSELLDTAELGLLRTLERDAELAIARRNWMEADHILARLTGLDPENSGYVRRLSDLRLNHAPIIYVKAGFLYQIGPDLADERLLFDEFPVAAPMWSPDRRKVTFFSSEASRSEIASLYVFDYETKQAELISEVAAPDPYVAWSPDSQRVAFVTREIDDLSGSRDRTYISMYNVETGEIDAIRVPAPVDFPPEVEIINDVASPTWSPQADRLAFIVIRRPATPLAGVANKFSDVYITNLATGSTENLTNQHFPAAAAVSWSPVDDQLLIWEAQGGTAWFESYETAIHLVDLNDNTFELLTSRTETTGIPHWSPDGQKYAVVLGDTMIRIRWLPGKRESSLSINQAIGGHITWSPDGNALIAVSSDSSQPSVLVPVPDGAAGQISFPVAYDGNWPNAGLQWGPATAAADQDSDT